MEPTKEQITAQYKKLPADLQKLVVSENLGIEIQLIGRDAGITPEQALDVEDVVVSVLMGTSHPKDFIRNIQSKIGVDEERARAIAEKVNEEIFQPVRESLKIVHNITEEASGASLASEASMASVPATPPPAPLSQLPNSSPTPPRQPRQTIELSFSHGAESNGESQPFPEMIRPEGVALKEVSRPEPAPSAASEPPTRNIFEQKLRGVFAMPREETLLPPKPPRDANVPPKPGADPYREPTK